MRKPPTWGGLETRIIIRRGRVLSSGGDFSPGLHALVAVDDLDSKLSEDNPGYVSGHNKAVGSDVFEVNNDHYESAETEAGKQGPIGQA